MTVSCSECDSPARSRGLCSRHYQRWRKYGDPNAEPSLYRAEFYGLIERLEKKSMNGMPDFSDPLVRLRPGCKPCRLFTGEKNRDGYGRIRIAGAKKSAHRAAFEELVGPVAPDVQLDHLCRNRACWEPTHLDPVTQSVNVTRGLTCLLSPTCGKGHEYTPENTYYNHGIRYCWECKLEYYAERKRCAEELGIPVSKYRVSMREDAA